MTLKAFYEVTKHEGRKALHLHAEVDSFLGVRGYWTRLYPLYGLGGFDTSVIYLDESNESLEDRYYEVGSRMIEDKNNPGVVITYISQDVLDCLTLNWGGEELDILSINADTPIGRYWCMS